jgi:branched-chain amino acid transport system substrate-binding protein
MRTKIMIIAIFGTLISLALSGHGNVSGAAEPYVVGYITDVTGDARANYAPDSEGFRLYMDVVNAQGGINGHPVKVIIEDGKSDPSHSAAVTKKLIIEDKVLAICGLGFSRSHPPVYELAKKEGVPVVVGYTCIEAVQNVKPGYLIFATGYIMHPDFHSGGEFMALAIKALKPKGAKVAMTGFATPGARVWNAWTERRLKEWGYNVVYSGEMQPTTVDLSPWVNKIAEIQPDIYFSDAGAEIIVPEIPALEKMGYTNDMIIPDFTPEGDLSKAMGRLVGKGEWVIWGGRFVPVYEDLPEMGRIKEAMRKYSHQYPLSSRTCHGWTIGRLMEQALTKAGWPCNRSNLITALEKTNLDTRGLNGGPILFTPTDHYGPTWWRAYRWNAAKKALVPATDWFKIEAKEIPKK